jgi:hypothetical protein
MASQEFVQDEAGVLSLTVQPARRSLSALWRQNRAAAKDAAVDVIAFLEPGKLDTVIASASQAIQSITEDLIASMRSLSSGGVLCRPGGSSQ